MEVWWPLCWSLCLYPALHHQFGEIINDHSLTQLVKEPIRQANNLDLMLISNPTLVNSVKVVPGISDHKCPVADIDMLPPHKYQPKRKVLICTTKQTGRALQNSCNICARWYSHPVHQSMTCGNSSREELKGVFKHSSPTRCSNRNKT